MKFLTLHAIALAILLFSACTPQPPASPSFPKISKDTTIKDLVYGDNAIQTLDLSLPANRNENTSLVIVIHGGGWSAGNKSDLNFMADGLKQRGFAVANINYRLSLQSTDNYAMQLDDVDAAIRFVLSLANLYAFNSNRIYLVGHSAGAHLALSYSYTRNSSNKVKAVGAIAAPTNLSNIAYYDHVKYGSVLTEYLGMPLLPVTAASDARYKNSSPLFQAELSSPPTILFHGDADIIVISEQSTLLANKLTTLKVDNKYILYSPFVGHDWWGDYARRDNTLDELATWFNNHR